MSTFRCPECETLLRVVNVDLDECVDCGEMVGEGDPHDRSCPDYDGASEGYVQSPIDNAVTENPADYVILRYADPADPADPLDPITVVDLPADNP